MRIAVVGAGVAGLVAAHRLHREHDVTVFEAGERPGGHAATVDVDVGGRRVAVDTGFVVFNEVTYPRFVEILREVGATWQSSDMSFGVRDERSGLEYRGSRDRPLSGLFAQRRNLLRPTFLGMLRDLLRFYREAPEVLDGPAPGPLLGDWLRERRYGRAFVEQHLVPMASAVWSAPPEDVERFPARTLVAFFAHHGFLRVRGRPEWLTIRGGSREYVDRLVAPFRDRVRLGTPVVRVSRSSDGVEVRTAAGGAHRFDRVVLALHADQALACLADPTPAERDVLGAFPFQENEVVLHTDASLLPRSRRAWASWNAHLGAGTGRRATLTYLANRLQSIEGPPWLCLTLNRTEAIDPARILRRFRYRHPQVTSRSVAAQSRRAEVSGVRRTHYAGAWWGYGFHEDGVESALAVVEEITGRGAA